MTEILWRFRNWGLLSAGAVTAARAVSSDATQFKIWFLLSCDREWSLLRVQPKHNWMHRFVKCPFWYPLSYVYGGWWCKRCVLRGYSIEATFNNDAQAHSVSRIRPPGQANILRFSWSHSLWAFLTENRTKLFISWTFTLSFEKKIKLDRSIGRSHEPTLLVDYIYLWCSRDITLSSHWSACDRVDCFWRWPAWPSLDQFLDEKWQECPATVGLGWPHFAQVILSVSLQYLAACQEPWINKSSAIMLVADWLTMHVTFHERHVV